MFGDSLSKVIHLKYKGEPVLGNTFRKMGPEKSKWNSNGILEAKLAASFVSNDVKEVAGRPGKQSQRDKRH